MNKQMHSINLVGYINKKPATPQQADSVTCFAAPGFIVDHSIEGTPVLHTNKGQYPLVWSRSGQYYEPKEDIGIKVYVTLKKLVGRVIYWA